MRRIGIGALLLVVFLATVFVGGALAHTFVASTTLTIHKVPTGKVAKGTTMVVYGKLKSDHEKCRNDKVVKLMKVRQGEDKVKAKDHTDSEGEYFFTFNAKKDQTLYTKFSKFVETSYGHSHTCKGDRSKDVKINVKK
jgi:hypothetical protein